MEPSCSVQRVPAHRSDVLVRPQYRVPSNVQPARDSRGLCGPVGGGTSFLALSTVGLRDGQSVSPSERTHVAGVGGHGETVGWVCPPSRLSWSILQVEIDHVHMVTFVIMVITDDTRVSSSQRGPREAAAAYISIAPAAMCRAF